MSQRKKKWLREHQSDSDCIHLKFNNDCTFDEKIIKK